MKFPKQQTLDEIRGMFSVFGMEPYNCEEMSQFEHAAQTAILAKKNGFDEEVQIAAFLHEIGNMLPVNYESELMVVFGRKNLEKAAARYLTARGFSEKVGALVENHLHAKRYLMYRYPSYINVVSGTGYQAFYSELKPMNEVEADAFEQNPYFDLIIHLRKWDDAARITGLRIPDLDHYLQLIKQHLERKVNIF